MLVIGVKQEEPDKIFLMMLVMAVGTFLPYIEIVLTGVTVFILVISFVIMSLHIYLLLCVVSIYIIITNKVKLQRVWYTRDTRY
ncbi:unnamed protein product [Chironomus riparius]|uniref:Uncharacterized protein n=1 Tax=Chironomus riparius TaxID=315576 RepID=A0A9N9S2I5_9DIPT|nr:unnamed protein product [Chironomus riparius]